MITHDRELAARLPRQIEMLDGELVSDSAPATGTALAGVSVAGTSITGEENS